MAVASRPIPPLLAPHLEGTLRLCPLVLDQALAAGAAAAVAAAPEPRSYDRVVVVGADLKGHVGVRHDRDVDAVSELRAGAGGWGGGRGWVARAAGGREADEGENG